jgi:agmatine deiminase
MLVTKASQALKRIIRSSHVLVPNYNDPNDAVANALIQNLYPSRKVVGIDFRNVYANGGMVHCVTQQQPK